MTHPAVPRPDGSVTLSARDVSTLRRLLKRAHDWAMAGPEVRDEARIELAGVLAHLLGDNGR